MDIKVRPNSIESIIENLLGTGAAEVVQCAQNAIFVCENGNILYANPKAFDVFKFHNISDVIGQQLSSFISGEFADIIHSDLAAFADETEGVPLKMGKIGIDEKADHRDITLYVNSIPHQEKELYLIECQDITEFLSISQATRLREERMNTIIQSVNEAIITIDIDGKVMDINNGCVQMFGWTKQEAKGQNVSIFMPEPDRSSHNKYLAAYARTRQEKVINRTIENKGKRKSGEIFPVELSISKATERSGKMIFTGIVRDISERKRQEEYLKYIAYHDALTDLPNRALFEENLEGAIARAQRSQKTMGLIFIDLDRFKPINDTFGHEAGDQVLIEVAKRFKKLMRNSDTVARIGGDEFVAIVENLTHQDDVKIVADKIIDCLGDAIKLGEHTHHVGASLGISLCPNHSLEQETLIDFADKAMYESKNAGRNCYHIYTA